MSISSKKSIIVGVSSFLLVLFSMPLGHALMILMEHYLSSTTLHYTAFAMGGVGLLIAIIGVFAYGDTRQTLYGLFGGLLFWTGWVEFIYVYFAHRFEVQPLMVDGEIVTKPEYLIMPSSFGFWVMFMVLYIFNTKTGCSFFNYLQKKFFKGSQVAVQMRPMAHHTSLVTFMELNLILWTSYLLLLFCYDDHFLGERHPVTIFIAIASLVGALFLFVRLIKIGHWGYAIRYAIPTVIVLWTFVEIMGRLSILREIWVAPMDHKIEMFSILASFIVVLIGILWINRGKLKRN